ncbi:MAG: rRNA maturation RNase YbeY [Rhodobacterales bacterium 65-51]|jgi:probable rRNA maturation factor|uniref:rRNA maturation RNase YbeY n=1 Tax=uncultured Gemmobacter sp. TaxID=1095917 RepID=UPI0009653A55|nr:rRNA maturation RNase YbeY [uncultured Gemmobacter sp.]OJY25539.1 MAG: rRNA maturation RNase YbeY [Rhodobacterales bacterium 65-51]
MKTCVDIVIEDDRWTAFGLDTAAMAAACATLSHLGMSPDLYGLVVLGCDDARIAGLNGEFRDKPRPTNVLSWPSEERGSEYAGEAPEMPEPGTPEDPAPLGDIAIAWETCAREAAEQGKTVHDHVMHLLVHGVLHLLGYDHIDEDDANLMEETERQILASLGIADPY